MEGKSKIFSKMEDFGHEKTPVLSPGSIFRALVAQNGELPAVVTLVPTILKEASRTFLSAFCLLRSGIRDLNSSGRPVLAHQIEA